jgi:hypothetical protein
VEDIMKVINLYAGPGTGKSTIMADLFAELKHRGHNAEMATEFAKKLVWENRHEALSDQLYIFGKQHHEIKRLDGQVDFVVTDSPLLLSHYYNKNGGENFSRLVTEYYQKYDNLDIFLQREKPYQPAGRTQTEAEARAIDKELMAIVDQHTDSYHVIPANRYAVDRILELLLESEPLCPGCGNKASYRVVCESGDGNLETHACPDCLGLILDDDTYDNFLVERCDVWSTDPDI